MRYKIFGVKAVAVLAVVAGAIATMQASDPPLPEDMQQPINILVSSTDTVLNGLPSGASGIASKPFFSVEQVDGTAGRTADKVKFQLATDPLFDDIIWGSGWKETTPVTSGERSDDVQKKGAGLAGLTTYYVRARFRNATEVGHWSVESFAFSTEAAALPATDYLIDGQPDGATNVELTPTFSAVYNHQDPAHLAHAMKVKIFLASDNTQVWGSGWVDIADLLSGTRGPDLTKTGAPLSGLTDYKVRILFRNSKPAPGPPPGQEPIDFTTRPAILPATDYLIDGQPEGATNVELKPTFSAVYNHQDPASLAHQMKVKIFLASDDTQVWGSGWVDIADLLPGTRGPDLTKTGPALLGLTDYKVLVLFKNGGVPPGQCPIDFSTKAAALPTTDYLVDGQPEGATNVELKPTFSAVYNHQDPASLAHQMKVKIFLASDDTQVWGSGWVDIADLLPGTRGPDLTKTGPALLGLTDYKVLVLFKNGAPPPGQEPIDFSTTAAALPTTDYLVDGQPEGATNVELKPTFSAVYNHQDPVSLAYQMKVKIFLASDDTQVWGSGWVDIADLLPGTRGPDLTKTGPALLGLTDYKVLVLFKNGAPPPGQEPIDFSTTAGPIIPTDVFVDSANAQAGQNSELNPIVDSTPVFSMIVDHQNTGAAITHVRIQISASPDFDDVLWNSGWESVSVVLGSRTSDIAYDGPVLVDGQQYYVRVRSKDDSNNKTSWTITMYSFVVQGATN